MRCLQWEPIQSYISCQQKDSANSMESMQAAAEAGQGKGGGGGECVSTWINHMKFKKSKCQSLHLGGGSPGSACRLGNEWLERSSVKKGTWGSWLMES